MGTKKFDFFSKKFKIEFDLYFDLCWRAEIIQVGLNMHLYVDMGMHRRPFEGRHLVYYFIYYLFQSTVVVDYTLTTDNS